MRQVVKDTSNTQVELLAKTLNNMGEALMELGKKDVACLRWPPPLPRSLSLSLPLPLFLSLRALLICEGY